MPSATALTGAHATGTAARGVAETTGVATTAARSELERLLGVGEDKGGMGSLFRVLALQHAGLPAPVGF